MTTYQAYFSRRVLCSRRLILPRSDDRAREHFDKASFGHVAYLLPFEHDWTLASTLLDRWRSESHTFHLPGGEMTIIHSLSRMCHTSSESHTFHLLGWIGHEQRNDVLEIRLRHWRQVLNNLSPYGLMDYRQFPVE
ncbi:hypothetical protein PIB30_066170 [Stylosanthes scabra]|uniref:Aminotransferase-like plant mobile domain-containing protein n=1 Tax=Stylosanthes scabra TaxID=79078 RepID=A0ABU6XK37_9FABA|nr:hypothetical protein [Stylosanthes scabra]